MPGKKERTSLIKHLVIEFRTMSKPAPAEWAKLTGLTVGLAVASSLVISVFDFAFVELLRLFV